jgi:hypothetical protein
MNVIRNFISIVIAVLFLGLNCSVQDNPSSPVAGGSTSEVGNGIVVGCVIDPHGSPAPGVSVRAVPADFAPRSENITMDTFPHTVTDEHGSYMLENLELDIYNLEAYVDTLGIQYDSLPVLIDTGIVTAPDLMLTATGTIIGVARMAGVDDFSQTRMAVYIPGTSWRTSPLPGGYFYLRGIPVGDYQLQIKSWLPGYYSYMFDITVPARDTVDMDTIYVSKY